jgi:hypothetical protein
MNGILKNNPSADGEENKYEKFTNIKIYRCPSYVYPVYDSRRIKG